MKTTNERFVIRHESEFIWDYEELSLIFNKESQEVKLKLLIDEFNLSKKECLDLGNKLIEIGQKINTS